MSPFGYNPPPREDIYAALFALLKVSPTFKTASRRLTSWAQVASEEKPALYQLQIDETVKHEFRTGMPYVEKMNVEIYLFVSQEDTQLPASSSLNPLVDAVFAALQPSDTEERLTLGDKVSDVKIGKVEYREGLLGPNAFAVIPIEILAAGLQPGGSED